MHTTKPEDYCLQGADGAQRYSLQWPHACWMEYGREEKGEAADQCLHLHPALSPVDVNDGLREGVETNWCLPHPHF